MPSTGPNQNSSVVYLMGLIESFVEIFLNLKKKLSVKFTLLDKHMNFILATNPNGSSRLIEAQNPGKNISGTA